MFYDASTSTPSKSLYWRKIDHSEQNIITQVGSLFIK